MGLHLGRLVRLDHAEVVAGKGAREVGRKVLERRLREGVRMG